MRMIPPLIRCSAQEEMIVKLMDSLRYQYSLYRSNSKLCIMYSKPLTHLYISCKRNRTRVYTSCISLAFHAMSFCFQFVAVAYLWFSFAVVDAGFLALIHLSITLASLLFLWHSLASVVLLLCVFPWTPLWACVLLLYTFTMLWFLWVELISLR